MKNIKGMSVEAMKTQCIGVAIESWIFEGTIEKVNSKSIIINFERMVHRFGKKVIADTEYQGKAKFIFWKTVDGKDIYKSQLNGIVEI